MPVYEYYCGDCGRTFEAIRTMRAADDPLTCAHCGAGQHISRTISLFATVTTAAPDTAPAAAGGCCGGACGCR
jgi:putative FmdB family regulatory protein